MTEKLIVRLKDVLKWGLKLLWPEVCPFCQKVSKAGICSKCRVEIQKLQVREPRCMKCGKPVRASEQEYCYDCMHTHHHYDKGVSLWLNKPPVSTSIYQFKYHNQRVYGGWYARELLRQYKDILTKWNPDLIIPIPLHSRRKRKRGYNQAQILAKELGKLMGVPVKPGYVRRIKYTEPQKQLGHKSRRSNLAGAFTIGREFRAVHTVLIVDDIYTTGSTIDAAAEILKKSGVQKVYFLTISIGQGI